MTTITKVELFKINIPYKEPFVISLGVIPSATNVLVKIHCSDGLIGTGECAPFVFIVGETQETVFELSKQIGKMLKGRNPYEIHTRLHEIEKAVYGNYTMKSAFDMALYDLMAQKANMPLYQLLGGSNNRTIYTDMTISIGLPEKMAADAMTFQKQGFPAIKVKLGTSLKEDVARIKEIREAVGAKYPIRIDANQGWDTTTAIKTLQELDQFDIEHCEEPIPAWNYLELPKVRQQSPIPIMADESVFTHHDAMKLAKLGACDYFNIKFSKSGGINTALKINAIAEGAGIKCQVGCMSESRFALTALMHFALACPNVVHYDIDSSLMLAEDPVVGGIKYQGKGLWTIDDAVGIGADIDERVLANSEKVIL